MIKRFFQPPEHDRWEDYFEPGEILLWQGAPEPGPTVRFKTIHARDSEGDKTMEKMSFDNISNGHEVYALFRKIQREQT